MRQSNATDYSETTTVDLFLKPMGHGTLHWHEQQRQSVLIPQRPYAVQDSPETLHRLLMQIYEAWKQGCIFSNKNWPTTMCLCGRTDGRTDRNNPKRSAREERRKENIPQRTHVDVFYQFELETRNAVKQGLNRRQTRLTIGNKVNRKLLSCACLGEKL